MFCAKCGHPLPDGSAFCSICGAPQPAQTPYQPPVQSAYEQPVPPPYPPMDPMYPPPYYYPPEPPALPMKWFKFLIYFSLFAAFVMNLIYGLNYITGGIYTIQTGVEASTVYNVFPVMKGVDIAFGLCQIGVAVYCLIVRQALAQYKANGPRLLLGLYAIQMIASLLYEIACAVVVSTAGTPLVVASVIGSCVGAIAAGLILISCNHIYFKKRAHLFIY
ncbi:MAG: zinc ribbon domain-containing protein [Clostridia bacterium]|nr:zinc ribbon domain-containing protein [Clostridia bacterium]